MGLLVLDAEALAAERTIETKHLRFVWAEDTGAYRIEDKQGGVTWQSNPDLPRFGEVGLPPFGFVLEAPEFVAFHALTRSDVAYPQPVLYTVRAEDGRPLARGRKVRVFHGFGHGALRFQRQTVSTASETRIEFR